ncbi:MAG: PilZ domain-containing protein [Thermodesulfovibrionales bacterium]|nr:PilZ domain-containing protein [Thermodesulfovibrionales bacterium]
MSKRAAKRYVRRLEAEFEGGGFSGRGLTSDVSRKGLFIRTQNALAPGTSVIVRLHLSDGKISVVKGVVRRAIKVPIYASEIKNGMGIEILEMDDAFRTLLNDLEDEGYLGERKEAALEDFRIIICPSCGIKNKVPADKVSLGPRCGKCKAYLMAN